MKCLYIDTHSKELVLALFINERVVCKKILKSEEHTLNTINMLNNIIKENNIKINDLDSIIIITGPGSFTGVRVGVVIAKMLGVTLNIEVKGLSYLEALSVGYDKDVNIGIKDKNGIFIGEFDFLHRLKKDYFYLSNKEFLNYNKDIIIDSVIDLDKVYSYMKDKKGINPHKLKPLYVKKIEVEK